MEKLRATSTLFGTPINVYQLENGQLVIHADALRAVVAHTSAASDVRTAEQLLAFGRWLNQLKSDTELT